MAVAPTGADDDGTAVGPTDGGAVRRQLERFAGRDRVTEAPDGTLTAAFSRSASFAVDTAGRVESGMPLHGFEGAAEELRFDHDDGTIRVIAGDETVRYTFRRP